ncbi:DUF255 domain-containing protein [Fulvivirga maritima]|uniref:thioredoxin family protein n=1 Tax=Fulvivirga maritima TaxID=2904247 RepID=UPI001F2BE582|nr:DUF255 domain-containing protein [Fulvivirga maritima]UII29448.1 DUF255 domain-containing protein [Fulvivirga maritima]
MKKAFLSIYAPLLLIVFIGSSAFLMQEKDSQPEIKAEEGAVKWYSFEEAVAKSKEEKKKVFVDVYTDWCGWCKVMDKNTFNQPDIAKYLNENFYPVKLNAEQRDSIVFKGTVFKFVPSGRKGYHELAAALLQNKLSYPTVVFLDEDFNMIQPVPGYQKPEMFDQIIKFIGGDHYKDTKWTEWQKEYQAAN